MTMPAPGLTKTRIVRRIIRTATAVSGIVSAAAIATGLYVSTTWDRVWDAPLPDIHRSSDPAVIRRGEYLVYGPAHCSECHVGSMAEAAAAAERGERPPLVGGTRMAAPPLGAVYTKNLTPIPKPGSVGTPMLKSRARCAGPCDRTATRRFSC
jgi:mono/diheme cytochrome c family protein